MSLAKLKLGRLCKIHFGEFHCYGSLVSFHWKVFTGTFAAEGAQKSFSLADDDKNDGDKRMLNIQIFH